MKERDERIPEVVDAHDWNPEIARRHVIFLEIVLGVGRYVVAPHPLVRRSDHPLDDWYEGRNRNCRRSHRIDRGAVVIW